MSKSSIHVIRVKHTKDFLYAVKTEGLPLRVGRTFTMPGLKGVNRPDAPLQSGATVWMETELEIEVQP